MAEKTREIVADHYKKYQQGLISENEAYENVKKIILDPDFTKIGKTGYIVIMSGKGYTFIHPFQPKDFDMTSYEFVQRAIKIKTGYMEYK